MPTSPRLLRAAATLAFSLAAPLAQAQSRGDAPPCAERRAVVERLVERWGETLQSLGLNADDGLLEVYASRETGTWTILVTRPDGTACMIASGDSWESGAAPLTKPGRDV